MQQFEFLDVQLDSGVALVTLNRPPVNAIDKRLREECIALFSTVHDNQRVRAVVLTGAGKMFSAGADLKDRKGCENIIPFDGRIIAAFGLSL